MDEKRKKRGRVYCEIYFSGSDSPLGGGAVFRRGKEKGEGILEKGPFSSTQSAGERKARLLVQRWGREREGALIRPRPRRGGVFSSLPLKQTCIRGKRGESKGKGDRGNKGGEVHGRGEFLNKKTVG